MVADLENTGNNLRVIKTKLGKPKMFDMARSTIRSITELGIALLALAIIATLLVGPANMAFLGDVVGNIMALVKSLGSAGLVGLISLGVVLWLFKK
jgi:hypothetical protein